MSDTEELLLRGEEVTTADRFIAIRQSSAHQIFEGITRLRTERDEARARVAELEGAAKEACDLLAERTHGNAARSPGHNARLRLERALLAGEPPGPAPRSPAGIPPETPSSRRGGPVIAPLPWKLDRDLDGKHWTDSCSIVDAEGGEVCILTRGYQGDAEGDGCPSYDNAELIACSVNAAPPQVTDEMVERAAKAIWEVTHPNPPGYCAWGDDSRWGPSIHERTITIQRARAALTAALHGKEGT